MYIYIYMYCSQLPSSNRAYCSVIMLKTGKVNLFFFFFNQCCTVNNEKSNNISQTPKLLTDTVIDAKFTFQSYQFLLQYCSI